MDSGANPKITPDEARKKRKAWADLTMLKPTGREREKGIPHVYPNIEIKYDN